MLYRVIFQANDNTYDLYCKQIYQSDLGGFIEIEDIIFQPNETLINPSEEKLRKEFEGVKRTFVPMYNLIRIDEVDHSGVSRVVQQRNDRVALFPNLSSQKFTPINN